MFLQVSQIFQRRISDEINRILKIVQLDMSSSINPQNNMDLNLGILHPRSKFGDPSLKGWWVIARTSTKWGKFWLWSWIWPWRSRSITPKTIGILTKVFYTYVPNMVIIAWTGDELTRAQTRDSWLPHTQTHKQIDGGNGNTRRPKLASGKNPISPFLDRNSSLNSHMAMK